MQVDVAKLEKLLRYQFQNQRFLLEALSSDTNAPLACLGDSVLQFIITNWLWQEPENRNQDILTRLRMEMVCNKTLARYAIFFGIHKFLSIKKSTSMTKGQCHKLATGFEAVVAAIYSDGGLEAATTFVYRQFANFPTMGAPPIEISPCRRRKRPSQDGSPEPKPTPRNPRRKKAASAAGRVKASSKRRGGPKNNSARSRNKPGKKRSNKPRKLGRH